MIYDEKNLGDDSEIYGIFRKRLKDKRTELRFTFEELERLTGIKRSSLQRYESGNTGKVPIDAVERLEKALNVSSGYLVGWNENPDEDAPKKDGFSFPIFPTPVRSMPYEFKHGASVLKDSFPSHHSTPTLSESVFNRENSALPEYDFCVSMPDNSMEDARLREKDLVYISKGAYIENGEIAAFMIKDELQIRYYYRGEDGHTLCASSRAIPPLSVKSLEDAGIKLIGKAVAFRSLL